VNPPDASQPETLWRTPCPHSRDRNPNPVARVVFRGRNNAGEARSVVTEKTASGLERRTETKRPPDHGPAGAKVAENAGTD